MIDQPSTLEQVLLEHALAQVLVRYASACDRRDWALLGDVFTPDCTTDYCGRICRGVDEVRHMISTHLDGCGPTQHLLGNLQVDPADASGAPRSTIHVRAVHQGLLGRAPLRYDAVGTYEDQWVHTADGWRIRHRRMSMLLELGDRSVLQPGG